MIKMQYTIWFKHEKWHNTYFWWLYFEIIVLKMEQYNTIDNTYKILNSPILD